MKNERNGFVTIANELLEKVMRFPFTKRELKLILYIIRYNCGSCQIFIADRAKRQREIAKKTGIEQGDISRTIKSLKKKNIIRAESNKLILNKHYKEWKIKQLGDN